MKTYRAAITFSLSCFLFGSVMTLLAGPSDPCALLTAAQASAALGGTVGTGKSITGKVCQWQQQGKAGSELLKLDVNLITPDRFTRMKSVTVGTVVNVGGLGDDAYYSTLKTGHTTITTLNIKKGDTAVVIRVSGGERPVEEYQAKEKAVAQVLVPKL
jgi:hypothetical protein